MILSKAKEIIALNLKEARPNMPQDVRDALNLAVQAIERVQASRIQRLADFIEPLPGETLE